MPRDPTDQLHKNVQPPIIISLYDYFELFTAKPPPPPKEVEVHTLAVLEGHEAYVDVGGWSPVSDVLVTASSDRTSYLWSLRPHQAPDRVELSGEDLDSPVSCLAWSEDGEGFVLGHDDGKVSLWSKDGGHVFTWWPHEAPVTSVSVRGLGRAPLILSGGDCSAVSQYMPGADRQEVRLNIVMLNTVRLNIVRLNIVRLNTVRLNTFRLNTIRLNTFIFKYSTAVIERGMFEKQRISLSY